MKISAKTISREVAALKKANSNPPYFLFIGPSTSLEETAQAVVDSGEDVTIIQDLKYHNRFMLCSESVVDYVGTIS